MAHVVDTHVGKRIRQRRWLIAMTQERLADVVGIRFQQIQKYETGANRVSASRLWDIARALDVPVAYFFDEMPQECDSRGAAKYNVPDDLMSDREAMELIRSYYAIPEHQRRSLFELARVLSDVA
jgi:transcriptional regulator with XRE-family HTH domain